MLVLTVAGRFVVSGRDVRPATGDLATMNASQLLAAVLLVPLFPFAAIFITSDNA